MHAKLPYRGLIRAEMTGPRSRFWNARGATVALLCGMCVSPAPARAEPASVEPSAQLAAEAAFADGVRLMKQERCSEAIEKFRASELLEPASGTLLNLAHCEVKLGRLASAWLSYRRAIPLAKATNKPLHEQIAREQAEKLDAELPRLSIVVPAGPERTLSIELDGGVVAHETWSVPVPVDPGPHRIATVLEDGRVWETTVSVAPSQHAVVELPPKLAVAPAPVPAPEPEPAKPSPTAPIIGMAEQPTHVERPTWALALTITGAATVVAGGALFVSARVAYDDARRNCTQQNQCDDANYDAERTATHRAQLSGVIVASGALLATGGLIAYFTLGKSVNSTRLALTGVAGPKDWLATVRGQF